MPSRGTYNKKKKKYEEKITYNRYNYKFNPILPGTIFISTEQDFLQHKSLIHQGVDKFNKQIVWDDMWNIKDGLHRIKNPNCKLCLLTIDRETFGYVWYRDSYLFNCFISKDRPDGISVPWLIGTFNAVHNTVIKLKVDKWNIRGQKFFEKVGFFRINS